MANKYFGKEFVKYSTKLPKYIDEKCIKVEVKETLFF